MVEWTTAGGGVEARLTITILECLQKRFYEYFSINGKLIDV